MRSGKLFDAKGATSRKFVSDDMKIEAPGANWLNRPVRGHRTRPSSPNTAKLAQAEAARLELQPVGYEFSAYINW
jgi:hypothetical protein